MHNWNLVRIHSVWGPSVGLHCWNIPDNLEKVDDLISKNVLHFFELCNGVSLPEERVKIPTFSFCECYDSLDLAVTKQK